MSNMKAQGSGVMIAEFRERVNGSAKKRMGTKATTVVTSLLRRWLVRPPIDNVRLTCPLCSAHFYYREYEPTHRVRESDWKIYCPRVCPGCGKRRRSWGQFYPPTHSCGWDVWKSETYKQKDYSPIDKKELESLKRFVGRKAEKGLGR